MRRAVRAWQGMGKRNVAQGTERWAVGGTAALRCERGTGWAKGNAAPRTLNCLCFTELDGAACGRIQKEECHLVVFAFGLHGQTEESVKFGEEMGELEGKKHVQYIVSVEKKKDSFEALVIEHLRLNGAYWGLTTLDLLNEIEAVKPDEIVQWIMQCQDIGSGGFGGNVGHDPHLLYTLSAVQVLALLNRLDVLDIDKVSDYVAGLQNEDGSFSGDMWGEVDTRFSYIAICCLSLLGQLSKINVESTVNYIVSCKNLDGGFGSIPGGESHAGQSNLLLKRKCVSILSWSEKPRCFLTKFPPSYCLQSFVVWVPLQSRDLCTMSTETFSVCYSWWVLSSLVMIDRVHWIDKEKLTRFILNCQDKENGGISDRPDNAVDVYHTYFGVAGLSLLEYPGIKSIDPAYALPVDVVNRIFFSK
ncbi:hypothetical protein ZIOFF_058700 [Zingiber officinale]|uniref:Geranylgeranyl transferase type-2 subunit beta n=1 Tax=Zingiber officinale TaxID=94328 RepID=A0A8J5KM56_ZINOF|nr:hypothetical protein ZIOFF_058700 [Zingiber officinale]